MPASADGARAARVEAWGATLFVAAACALSAWRRWRFLDSSPYPMGVDGYFYAAQVRSVLEHGHLLWPSSPLVPWLTAPFAALTDPIVGAKLVAALGGAAVGAPAYALGRRLGGGRGAGLVACALATASAGSFYLSIEFVKQGVGVTVALAALVAIARALEAPRRGRIAIAMLAVAATWATHKSAAALVAIGALPALAIELRARGWLDARRARRVLLAVAAALAIAVALGALFPSRFVGPGDLGLAAGLVSSRARWSLPALELNGYTLAIGHEALLGAIAAAAFVAVSIVTAWSRPAGPAAAAAAPIRPADRAIAVAMAALALAIALPWLDVGDPQGLAFRLRLVAFAPFALTAAAALGPLVACIPRSASDRGWPGTALAAALAAGWLVAQPAIRDEGVVRAHPALVAAARALEGCVPRGDTVVVTERDLAFMAAYYARVDVALDPATVPRARRWRLLPLAFIGLGSPLDHALTDARRAPGLPPPRGLHPGNPNGVVLVAEPTWDWVLDHLPPHARAWASAWHTI